MYYAYLFTLFAGSALAVFSWKSISFLSRMISLLIMSAFACEVGVYILSALNRNAQFFYHIYTPFQGIILFNLFLFNFGKYNRRNVLIGIVFWILTAVLGAVFIDPIDHLNNRVMLLNSFIGSVLSLVSMYYITAHSGNTTNSLRKFILFSIFLFYFLISFVFLGLIHEIYESEDIYHKINQVYIGIILTFYFLLLLMVIGDRTRVARR